MSIRLVISFISMLLVLNVLGALDPPEIKCVATKPNGEIELTWAHSTGPGPISELVEYIVYSRPFGTSLWTRLDSTVGTSYTDGASVGIIEYAIVTKYNQGLSNLTSVKSSIAQKMVLDVSTSGGTSFPPVLSWNPPFNPLPASSSGIYKIFRQVGIGPWVEINSVTSQGLIVETFIDNSIYLCSQDINYRVEIEDLSIACSSISNEDGELFEDKDPPDVPTIKFVGYDITTGGIIVEWNVSNDLQTGAYDVHYLDAQGIWQLGDTLKDIASDSTLLKTFPTDTTISVAVASIDTCGNKSSNSNVHKTSFLTAKSDLCERTITLNWSPYVGWSTITGYEIYCSENGGQFKYVEFVNNDINTFIHEDRSSFVIYTYYIVARSGNGYSSNSNPEIVQFENVSFPKYQYLRYASVISENAIELMFLFDRTSDIEFFAIKRGLSKDGPFETVGLIEYDKEEKIDEISFIDSTAKPNQTEYFYRVDGIDICNKTLMVSNVAKTIYLDVSPINRKSINRLGWTKYIGWDTIGDGVQRYRIVKYLEDENQIVKLDSTGPTTRNFEDITFEDITKGDKQCYYISAIEKNENIYGYRDVSKSNVKCIYHTPEVWVPNAFTPNNDGVNDYFIPNVTYVDGQKFNLLILDRWGAVVQNITDSNKGWDGRFDGVRAPTGMYIYTMTIETYTGDLIEQTGTFHLVR